MTHNICKELTKGNRVLNIVYSNLICLQNQRNLLDVREHTVL